MIQSKNSGPEILALTRFDCFFLVENWEMFEQMLDYTYNKHIKSQSSLHPVMMSEPAVSNGPDKQKNESKKLIYFLFLLFKHLFWVLKRTVS